MGKLVSRKLVLGALAIAGNAGIVLGLAAIDPTLLTEAKEIVALGMLNVTAIAGVVAVKQADIDKVAAANNPAFDKVVASALEAISRTVPPDDAT